MGFFSSIFKRKQKLPEIGFTNESAKEGGESKHVILEQIRRKSKISHSDLNVLAHLFFNTTIQKNSYFVFRNLTSLSGEYYEIVSIQLDVENKNLEDIKITLKDAANNTSLRLDASVKDFNEIFKPFVPDFAFLKQT